MASADKTTKYDAIPKGNKSGDDEDLDTQQLRAMKGDESDVISALFAEDSDTTDPAIVENLNKRARMIFDDLVNRLTMGKGDDARAILVVGFGEEIVKYSKERALLESRAERKGAIDSKTGFLKDDSYAARLFDLEKRLMLRDNERERALMLVRIDFDDFKTVNDIYGHDAGDAVLVDFAKRVKESLRGRDTTGFAQQSMHGLPGRPGGDEFYLVFNSIDLKAEPEGQANKPIAEVLLERLSRIAADVVRPDGKPLTLSMGYRLIERNNVAQTGDFVAELANADMAQMAAKIKGGNQSVEYAPGMELPPMPPEIARERILRSVARTLGIAPDMLENTLSAEQLDAFVHSALKAAELSKRGV